MSVAAQVIQYETDVQDYGEDVEIIEPQEGPQTEFVASLADIVIYGGEAGGGKSWGLEFIPLAYVGIPSFDAIIFRRTSKQIKTPGGLWDGAIEMYSNFDNAEMRVSDLQWRFHTDEKQEKVIAKITFSHLEHEKNKLDHQGGAYAYIGFDELTHFTKTQFTYLLSRNRSMSGVRGLVRATCNPDPDSFVRELIDWWIYDTPDNKETDGYVIKERCGIVRFMIVDKGEWNQYNTMDELLDIWNDYLELYSKSYEVTFQEAIDQNVKTITFIHARLEDNKKLIEKDPSYVANLNSLGYIDFMRLRKGNWNVRPSAGMYFKKDMFEILPALPARMKKTVRFWDRAATAKSEKNPDPDWTVGIKMSIDYDGFLYVHDMVRFRENPGIVETRILNTAKQDTQRTHIHLEQEPAASGKTEVQHLIRKLLGYNAKAKPKITKTEAMVRPVAAQAKANNIKIIEGKWNYQFLKEIEDFPETVHDDIVVAFIGAFNGLFKTKKAGTW